MPQKRLLVSWIGHNDMRSLALSLPETAREEMLATLPGGPPTAAEGIGPIKTLVNQEAFDEIRLLSNYDPAWEQDFAAWLGDNVHVVHVELENPTDYTQIFEVVDGELARVKSRSDWAETDLSIHLSPGTPAMAAVWLLLGKTRYPATFYQTYRGKVWVTNVPFDLAVDFVPEVFRDADAHLQHLAALSPGETEGFEAIAGDSRAIRLAVGRAKRAAIRSVPVLLSGESGTGKELFAKAIHEASARRNGIFLPINCAAIPRELLESELFGHKAGGFSDAKEDREGAFDKADGGTLFLDEIGECDAAMQTKLLRVLQPPADGDPCRRSFFRVGDSDERHSSVRIIAATNRDLIDEVANGKFREDLYYRLAVINVTLPPLRERAGDVSMIAERLFQQITRQFEEEEPGYRHKSISGSAMLFVQRHPWPGNVRQLYNALLQAAVMAEGDTIEKHDLADAVPEIGKTNASGFVLDQPLGDGFVLQEHLNEIQRNYLRRAMEEAGGVKAQAAKLLGMANYQTLDAQLKRLGVEETW